MQICCHCDRVFEDDQIVQRRDYETGYHEYVCPHCGSDEIYEAVQCEVCGEWMAEDEIESGFCLKCLHDAITYDVALAYMKTHVGWLSNFVVDFAFPNDSPVLHPTTETDTRMEQCFNTFRFLDDFRPDKPLLEACRNFCLPDYSINKFGVEGMQFAEWLKDHREQ